ncbi:Alpha/Beta hydrolase protein [Cercophora newfieldiana]|uniref:Alpha/Beta hydrolase protein n=1 Tax=Cercophora newfieldiana TaxID=92897 RepID=A0AA39YH68_9PEZI|nr:Alpha/Beta hydrolase protein [Cercophora newfieldiana]
MGLTSDILVDRSKFDPSQITEETHSILSLTEQISTSAPKWKQVGAAKFRAMCEAGETPFPPLALLPGGKNTTFPSRDPSRAIPARVYAPDNGAPSRGLLLYLHGGGFVMGTYQEDANLQRYANACQVTAISVDYRLAPEDPWPAAPHDVFDVAIHLVDNGESLFGAPLRLITGISAGGALAAQAAFHLVRERPEHDLAGVVFQYAWFDVSLGLPSMKDFHRPLFINEKVMTEFMEAYTPGMTVEERRNPLVSPLYDDLINIARAVPGKGKALPPALFLCGTLDPLLDDTLLMSAKWMATGSETVVKILNGAAHGFTMVPGYSVAKEAVDDIFEFMNTRPSKV